MAFGIILTTASVPKVQIHQSLILSLSEAARVAQTRMVQLMALNLVLSAVPVVVVVQMAQIIPGQAAVV